MPTINQFSAVTSLNPSDQLLVFSSNNGDTRKASISTLLEFFEANFASPEFVEVYANPTLSGFVVPIPDSTANQWLILAPTGAFAAGSITLPLSSGLVDGQQVLVTTTQATTTFLVNGNGASVIGFPTALGAGGFFSLRYEKLGNRWFTTSTTLGVTSTFSTITLTSDTGTIKDVNSQTSLQLTKNYPGVVAGNFVQIDNRATGDGPSVSARGVDTNISLTVSSKGTGELSLSSSGCSFNAADVTLTLTSSFVTSNCDVFTVNGALAQSVILVAALGTATAGHRNFVSNSTVAASGNFGAIVAGGGTFDVPVFADGASWRIG